MKRYRKFFVALGGFLAVASSVLSDGVVAPTEYETVVFALATALGVFWAKNEVS